MKLLKAKHKKEAEQLFAEGVRQMQEEESAKAVEAFKASLKLRAGFPRGVL